MIRQSSRSYTVTLARNFATSNRALEDLEDLVLTALETLYPNASESLRKHICNTITDRYAKLEYNAYQKGKSRSKSSKQSQSGEAATGRSNEGQAVGPSLTISRPNTVDFDHIQKEIQDGRLNIQQKPLSSLDTGFLRQSFNDECIKTPQSKKTLSAYENDNRLHEPQPPRFEDGEAQIECEWCYELLDRSIVRNNGWSDIGRLHYKRDLKPFPCLSEACGESRPSFSSRKGWFEHMRSKHSTSWPQSLYGERIWACHDHIEDGESIRYAFSSKNDLDRHMLLIHGRKKRFSESEFTEYLEPQHSLIGITSPRSCPLCLFVIEDKPEANQTSSSRHGGLLSSKFRRDKNKNKNQKSADSRVKFADDVKPASDDDDDGGADDLDDDSSNVFAMELHIAAHLQYLLVMSLRFMAALAYDADQDPYTDPNDSSGPATGSMSFVESGLEVNARLDEESAVAYISDSERHHLEQMRSNEEAGESLMLSYEKDQWNGINPLLDYPIGKDFILQHLSSRQKEFSRVESCRKSVSELRQGLTETLDRNLENASRWRKIGLLQGEIYDETRNEDDLDEAIEAFKVGKASTPVGHPDEWRNLADLSTRLVDKYKTTRHKTDLDKAFEITKRVIATMDDPYRLTDHYDHLAYLHSCRYSETGEETELISAIQISQQVLKLFPADSNKQAKYHNNLGQLLTLDYWRTGVETTIDEAISELRLALHLAVEKDNEYSEYLATLSAGLDKKFAVSGSQEQLDEAMQLMRQAIDLVSEHDPTFLKRLNALGAMLGELYKKTGELDALEESIKIGQRVLDSTYDGDINFAERTENLAARLTDRFHRFGGLGSLDEAISLSISGKAHVPVEASGYHVYCHNVATRILERFHKTGSIRDLEDAIENSKAAVKFVPDTDVHMATYLCVLADATLVLLDNRPGDYQLRDEPLRLYKLALHHDYSAVQCRLQAGRRTFQSYVKVGDWHGAYMASDVILNRLAQLPFADLDHVDRQRILETTVGITSEGIAAALNAGRPPLEVLSWLEYGRCLYADSRVQYEADVVGLRREQPSIGDEFIRILADLGKPITVPMVGFIGDSPWRAQSKRRYEASIKFKKILGKIRTELGFPQFLLGLDEESMLQAGDKGPVVVLNTSRIRCDAIIIYLNKIEVLSLPDLEYDSIVDRSDSGSRCKVQTLLWLWETIAMPILAHLGLLSTPSASWLRMWLIPTGPLTNFPIHAAGDYRSTSSESILDYAVCSYTPSIGALVSARDKPVAIPEKAQALVVGTEHNPGFPRLPFVSREISTIQNFCRSTGLDIIQPRHKEGVLQTLASCTIFHFAGMFNAIMEDPLENQLFVEDGSITVNDILDATLSRHPPLLAYLSSCATARTNNKEFADECLHAAGALHMGGFRHAIGTLDYVSDEVCAETSSLFYEALMNRGLSNDTVALCLHDATRRLRDQWIAKRGEFQTGQGSTHRGVTITDDEIEERLHWALFIHFGV
ncbi:hypothetical protein ACHAP5_011958 [Fusarium lateritium]